jgi:hypothetical protein
MSLEKQTLAMSPDGILAAARSRSMKSPDAVIPPAVGFDAYDVGDFYDEMFDGDRQPRSHYRALYDRFWQLRTDELERRQMAAERSMRRLGITFSVYGDQEGSERIIPFDICPRIIPEAEWKWLERGLKQRIIALNKFIDDIYHKQMIVRDGVVPEFVVRSSSLSIGRLLRLAESAADQADVSADLRASPCAAGRRLLQPAPRRPAGPNDASRAAASCGAANAGLF